MISPHPLDRLIEQETFAEAMALLEPEELVISSLRLEGLSDEQIASLLDIDRATLSRRMEQARQRITEELPELALVLRDRRHRPLRSRRPLQRGWLCPDVGDLTDFHHRTPFLRRVIRGLSSQDSSPALRDEKKGSHPRDDPPSSVPEPVVRAGTGR